MRRAFAALLVLLSLSAPAHGIQQPGAGVLPDASRIVTLGGSVTEIVYALGLGDRVVASDRTSLFPESVRAKPRLDILRTSSAESIIAQRPTLVVATEALGPPSVRVQLRDAGMHLVVLEEVTSTDSAIKRLVRLANLLGKGPEGARLSRSIDEDLDRARALQDGPAPRVMFVYARGSGTVQVGGLNTGVNTMIVAAGGINAMDAFEGFRPISAEAVVKAQPDIILLPSRGLASLGGMDGLLRQPGIRLTPGGRARRIITLDDALLLSLGPRLGKAALALARLLYPKHVSDRK